jgi:FkbM family methyltransferase
MLNKIRVDIGLSHSAPCSFDWLKKDKNLIIHAFEPSPKNNKMIKQTQNYSLFKERFVLHEYGLSNCQNDEIINFYETEVDSGCSSFFQPNEKLTIPFNVVQASIKNAKIIFDLTDNNIIELLKTDTQGNDYNIIQAIQDKLSNIVFLDIELEADQYSLNHDYQNSKLINFIELNNFQLIEITNGNGRFYNKLFIDKINKGVYNNDTIYPFT